MELTSYSDTYQTPLPQSGNFDQSDMSGKHPKRRVEHGIPHFEMLQIDTPPAGWNYSVDPISRVNTPSTGWNGVVVELSHRGPLPQGGTIRLLVGIKSVYAPADSTRRCLVERGLHGE